jgi:hypothetical protein
MEKNELINDDFLKKLVRKSPLDEPSAGFEERVMAAIRPGLEPASVHKPFYMILKSSWWYVALGAGLVIFFLTSDLPFTQFMPGKQYFTNTLLPYFDSLFTGLRDFIVNSRFTTMGLLILAAGGLLFLFDYFFNRRSSVKHQSTAG